MLCISASLRCRIALSIKRCRLYASLLVARREWLGALPQTPSNSRTGLIRGTRSSQPKGGRRKTPDYHSKVASQITMYQLQKNIFGHLKYLDNFRAMKNNIRYRCRKCKKRRYSKYLWETFSISRNQMEYECHNCEDDNRGRKPKFKQIKLPLL